MNESGDEKTCPHCAEPIQAAAKVCKHCGKSLGRSFWKTVFLVVGIFVVLSFGGCVALCGTVATKMAEESKSAVTLAEFNKLENGMSYEEVCQIIGKKGSLMSENNIAGCGTEMYTWKGIGIANMNATFQNGRLMSKAQLGLTDPAN